VKSTENTIRALEVYNQQTDYLKFGVSTETFSKDEFPMNRTYP